MHPASMAIQRESAELADVVEETVSGVRVVKGFGAEPVMAGRSRPGRRPLRGVDGRRPASGPATCRRSTCCPTSALILVLAYGGHQVLDGQLSSVQLVAFNLYIGLLIWPLRMTGQIIALGQRAVAAAAAGRTVLATEPAVVDDAPDPRRPARRRRRGALRGRVLRLRAGGRRPCWTAST